MGQSLTIWKWRPLWPFRSEARVLASLEKDCAPFAITRFDAVGFAGQIHQAFGDGDDAPFHLEVCDFTGEPANWIVLSSGWSTPHEKLAELERMCRDRGLHFFADG